MHDVIIMGAGPSGIALGSELVETGINTDRILILEKADQNSRIMRQLYPEQKLVTANFKGLSPICHRVMRFQTMQKDEALRVMKESIDKYKLNIQHETNVIKVYEAKICIVSIGKFGKPNKPSYKIPPTLLKKTSYDITSTKIENSDVLVVGGGDSASEYVQHLILEGNTLSISCREESFWRMNEDNRSIRLTAYRDSNVEKIEDLDGRLMYFLKVI